MPQFLDDQTYDRLVDSFITTLAGLADRDAVKIFLGERLNIWPLSIAIANLEDGLDRRGDPIGDC